MKRFLFFSVASILFLLSAFVYDGVLRNRKTNAWAAELISNNLQQSLADLEKEAMLIRKDTALQWSSMKNIFLLLDSGSIANWSRNDFAILPNELIAAEDFSLTRFSKSVSVIRKWKLSEYKILVGIIPLFIDNRIVNQYIQPWLNPAIFPEGASFSDASGEDVCVQGRCLFEVEMRTTDLTNPISFDLSMGAMILFMISIFLIARFWHKKERYLVAFVNLFGLLALLRISMVEFSIPSRWTKSIYFSPTYFASSSFNASAADFLLNSLIVAFASGYLFYVHSHLLGKLNLKSVSPLFRRLLSVALLTIAFFSFLFPYLFIESIFHDSKIIFDISENVNMDGMQVLAIVSVVFGCLSSFFFLHFLVRWSISLSSDSKQFIGNLVGAVVIFIAYAISSEHNYWITITLTLVYISVLYFSDYFRIIGSAGFKSFAYLLIPVVCYSLQIALADWRFTEEQKVKSMQRFAMSVLERDVLGEYLLSEAVQNIASDPFILSSMSNPLLSKRSVRDKIKGKYLNNYFDRYHLRIALYKTDGLPADRLTGTDLVSTIKSYTDDANKTQYPNVYYVRNQPKSTTQYLAFINLSPSAGFIILELSLKRIIPRQTLPDLVVDNRFTQSFRLTDFSFAFYNDKLLTSSFGNFNFEKEIDPYSFNLKARGQSIRLNKSLLISTSDENERSVVVASSRYPFFMVLGNFSFFFVIGISLVFFLIFVLLLNEFRKGKSISYTTRVQSFAYIAFILPLVGVSFMALRMINQADETQVVENNLRRGQLITEGLSGLMSSGSDSTLESSLRNYLIGVARTSSFDLTVFDPDGKLLSTSSPEIMEAGLFSNLINRVAWERLVKEGVNSIQVPGKIGTLSYSSLFFSIRSDVTGDIVGVLELPFIRADESLNKSKINVMANILVIFTGMFLLFTFVAIVSIDSFTWPFRLMAKTLKSTRIGGNKPMKWESNDEVGLMVKEYNQMVANLEKSKQALEKSQRESAWREIAQQVAHEIKNPLTPIKLTLQQMERNLSYGLEPEKVQRSIKSLLSHVDNLTDIATAFSSFAKLPSPEVKTVDVNEVIREAVNLYKMHLHKRVEIINDLNIEVKADPKLLLGVFSNIILNAFQSKSENEQVNVFIKLSLTESSCIVSFKDNGSGISDALKEQIFIPHFSTKDSGSGLGLAISKQAIESMGGKIWFESSEGLGTTFFVELMCG